MTHSKDENELILPHEILLLDGKNQRIADKYISIKRNCLMISSRKLNEH